MRFSTLTVGLLAALAPITAAWTKEGRFYEFWLLCLSPFAVLLVKSWLLY